MARADEPVEPPVVSDPRLRVDLIAREPAVVTPVGLAVDGRGRLYVVESHTHFRPPEYKGPAKDQIKRLEDRDGDGTFETVSVFAEGFTYAMNLAFGPGGHLHVVERGRVVRLEDANDDGKVDRQVDVLRLETPQKYPHNGLGGIVFGRDGWLYVGLGENRGSSYTLRGTDDSAVPGGGEGGNVFRCRPDGREVQRFATGFWNPFALTFYGSHLLAIDDDPEVRPPDRLLDVIAGADFGFKFKYGQAAEHPFIAWKGELPGTLSMVGPIGEGATGIMTAADALLPAEYGNAVIVTSWSDRRLELHRLQPRGASLRAEMKILVQGGRAFRPVALATGPDGSIYFTDWVRRRYEIHGHGRVWRLRAVKPPAKRPTTPPVSAARRALETLSEATAKKALASSDPHMHAAATAKLGREAALKLVADKNPRVRLGALLALRRDPKVVARGLEDQDLAVRTAALIAGAEGALTSREERQLIHKAVIGKPTTPQLLAVYRAAAALLEVPVAPELAPSTPAALLEQLGRPGKPQDQQEAIWKLAKQPAAEALSRFEAIAADARFALPVRLDAIGALAMHGRVTSLVPLLKAREPRVQVEVARALRAQLGEPGVREGLTEASKTARGDLREELRFALGEAPPRPETPAAWLAATRGGDVEAGRRVFVHPSLACSRCHRVGELGTQLGPPLTFIGNERPERLLESLLDPAIDVVWPARIVRAKDGSEHHGMIRKRHPDGTLTLANAAGGEVTIPAAELVFEREAEGSLMPDGLHEAMTMGQFRDLFAFLRAQNR